MAPCSVTIVIFVGTLVWWLGKAECAVYFVVIYLCLHGPPCSHKILFFFFFAPLENRMTTGTWVHMVLLALVVGLTTDWEVEARKAKERVAEKD